MEISFKQLGLAGALCLAALILLTGNLHAQGSPTTDTPASAEAPPKVETNPMRKVFKVDFRDESFDTCLKYLKAMSGLKIAVNWQALKAAGVTGETKVSLKNDALPFYLILQETLDRAAEEGDARLHYFASRNYLVITSMKAYLKRQRYLYDSSPQSQAIVQRLDQPLSVQLKGKGAFLLMSKIYLAKQMPMLIDEAALKASGVNLDAVDIELDNAPGKSILELAFRQMEGDEARITCNIRDGVLYVTSIDKATKSRIYWKDLSPASNEGFAKLAKRINVPNEAMSLTELGAMIAKQTGVKFHVDAKALIAAKVDVTKKLDLSAITQMRGDELLRIGLELSGERLGYAMVKGHVFVSSHEEVKKLVRETE